MSPPARDDDPDPESAAGGGTDHGALVLASDETYFSLGAERQPLPGLDLYVHHGFTDVAAAVVAVGAASAGDADYDVASGLGSALDQVPTPTLRVYVSKGSIAARRSLERALRPIVESRGTEVALAARADRIAPARRRLVLRPITTDADWARKLEVHLADARGPDGHAVDPHRWVAFERAKAEDPSFQPMLVVDDHSVVGTVALLEIPGLVRIKNLVVAPDRRGEGLARDLIGAIAASRPGALLGGMAIAESTGLRAYIGAGLAEVGRVDEWLVPAAAP